MYDVIIVGSGPAGLTAAIYTSRARLKTLVIAGTEWGGQLMLTTEIENYPGFHSGIQGPNLIDNLRTQAERFGAEILFEDATEVNLKVKPFRIKAGNIEHAARAVIIAVGSYPKWLGLPSEQRLRGRGVSVCATCDAAFFLDKVAVVVGGGDTAMEEALALANFAETVKIVHRRNELKASKILQERVRNKPKIEFIWNSTVQEILGETRVEAIRLRRVDTGEESTLKCDAVFIAIGYKPNTELFKDQLKLDPKGYIIAQDETKTNIRGVFVAGDVQDSRYRQAVTAAAAGCKAAIDAEKYLREED
jgi:thioredoxin reductase (NADPH)